MEIWYIPNDGKPQFCIEIDISEQHKLNPIPGNNKNLYYT